jgi:hypothetical protein
VEGAVFSPSTRVSPTGIGDYYTLWRVEAITLIAQTHSGTHTGPLQYIYFTKKKRVQTLHTLHTHLNTNC